MKKIFLLLVVFLCCTPGLAVGRQSLWNKMTVEEKAISITSFLSSQSIGCMDASIATSKITPDNPGKEDFLDYILETCVYTHDTGTPESLAKMKKMYDVVDLAYLNEHYANVPLAFMMRSAARYCFGITSYEQYWQDLDIVVDILNESKDGDNASTEERMINLLNQNAHDLMGQ